MRLFRITWSGKSGDGNASARSQKQQAATNNAIEIYHNIAKTKAAFLNCRR